LRLGYIIRERGVHMPKTKAPYPTEFKSEAVRLCRESGKPRSMIARDLGVSSESLRAWMRRDDIDSGKREGLTTTERDEIGQLRRENRILREEREILKKAAAFFARETERTR
jgi:transposase